MRSNARREQRKGARQAEEQAEESAHRRQTWASTLKGAANAHALRCVLSSRALCGVDTSSFPSRPTSPAPPARSVHVLTTRCGSCAPALRARCGTSTRYAHATRSCMLDLVRAPGPRAGAP